MTSVGEAQVEAAAGGEPGRRFASDEFFFLLQRVDRLDEKVTSRIDAVMARIDAVDAKLTARVDAVDGKLAARIDEVRRDLDGLRTWAVGLLFTVLAGFSGVIVALLRR